MASTLVSLELDPVFVKALRLLHSKAKDSADQLRQMLEDVLQQKTTSPQQQICKDSKSSILLASSVKKTENNGKLQLLNIKKSPKHAQDFSASATLQSKKSSKEEGKKREPEKRSFDKVKQEISDSLYEVKKPKLEVCKEPRSPSPPSLKLEIKQEDEESDLGNTDADDFAMEMGLACVVCRNIDVSSGNQLVECQECHNLYHQECHKPPITDQDVNDPRLVWYCAKCAKNIKKLASKNQKPSKSIAPNTPKEHSNFSKVSKPEPTSTIASSRLFKRTEVKSPLSITTTSNSSNRNPSSSNKPTGLAGLAASLSGRSNTGKSSQGNSSSKTMTSSKPVANVNKNLSGNSQVTKNNPFPASSSTKTQSGNGNSSSSKSPSKPPSFTAKSSSNNGNNSGNSSSSSSSSSSSGNSSSNGKNSNSLMSADKRLQIMKKKAEKKMQEKRWK